MSHRAAFPPLFNNGYNFECCHLNAEKYYVLTPTVTVQFSLQSDQICAELLYDFHSLILASFTSLRRYLQSIGNRLQIDNLGSVAYYQPKHTVSIQRINRAKKHL